MESWPHRTAMHYIALRLKEITLVTFSGKLQDSGKSVRHDENVHHVFLIVDHMIGQCSKPIFNTGFEYRKKPKSEKMKTGIQNPCRRTPVINRTPIRHFPNRGDNYKTVKTKAWNDITLHLDDAACRYVKGIFVSPIVFLILIFYPEIFVS